jgi:ABC-type nitrate/sulfonate/bicarbonate transport system permease component
VKPLSGWIRWRGCCSTLLGIGIVALVWVHLSAIYPPGIVPPMRQIASAVITVVSADRFAEDLQNTLLRVAGSFLVSLVVGVALGIVAGLRKAIADTLHPMMVIAESAPPMAWLVLAILFFGMGHGPSFIVGLSAAVPIFFFHTVPAVGGLDRRLVEMAAAYDVPRRFVLRSVYLPGILLGVVGASSSSLSVVWRVVIMAEAFTTGQGLGPQLWGSYLYADTGIVFAYIAVIIGCGFLLEYGLIRPGTAYVRRRLRIDGDES